MTKTETKKDFTMVQAFSLWEKQSKKGERFFGGGDKSINVNLIAFYNGNKKNPKEPDLRVYEVDADNKISKTECASLWLNVGKNDNQYLTGTYRDKKVVGFINKTDNKKAPYIRVYYKEETDGKKEEITVNIQNAPF